MDLTILRRTLSQENMDFSASLKILQHSWQIKAYSLMRLSWSHMHWSHMHHYFVMSKKRLELANTRTLISYDGDI